MAPLIDPVLLLRILGDPELTKALAAFFDDMAERATATCTDIMAVDHPDTELARKHACYAKAYKETMGKLRAYAKQV